jgi:diphosphomevalonate decarboxylase
LQNDYQIGFRQKRNDGSFSFDLLLKGIPKKISNRKFKSFRANRNLFAVLKDYHFTIDTENTFPHSSGIASSASGMAA